MNARLFAAFDFVSIVHDSGSHEFRLPSQYTDVDRKVSPVARKRLRQHVALASDLNPTLPPDVEHTISDLHERAEHNIDERESIPAGLSTRESLVRLAKASARIRLSDTANVEDVWIAAVGVPDILGSETAVEMAETVCFSADIDDEDENNEITTNPQRKQIKNMKDIIEKVEDNNNAGAPIEEILRHAEQTGITRSKAEHEVEKLRRQGEVYEPQSDHLRTT